MNDMMELQTSAQTESEDLREKIVRERLEQLTSLQLMRIFRNRGQLCTDTFNFDATTRRFCPIAYALNAHVWVLDPTDEKVRDYIAGYFKEVNVLKGVPGKFYHGTHEERLSDLIGMVEEIMATRKEQNEQLNGIQDN